MKKKIYFSLLIIFISTSCAKTPKESIFLKVSKIEKLSDHEDRLYIQSKGKKDKDKELNITLRIRSKDIKLEGRDKKNHIAYGRSLTCTISKDKSLELDLIFGKNEEIEHISSISFKLKTDREILASLYSVKNGHKLHESSIPPLDSFLPVEIPLDTIKMKYLTPKTALNGARKRQGNKEEKKLFLKIENKENKKTIISLRDFRVHKFMSDEKISTKLVKILEHNINSIVYPLPNEIKFMVYPEGSFYLQGYLGNKTTDEIAYSFFINDKKASDFRIPYNEWKFIKIPVTHENKKVSIKIKSDSEGMGILGSFVLVPQQMKVKQNQRIVIYLADALRSDFGGIDYSSLELSEDFKDGIYFKNAYSNAIETRDSLPVLFTGIYKYIINNNSDENPFVYDDYETITEYLGKKGFHTAAFVANSWLLLSNSHQGFDYIYHNHSKIKTEDTSNTSTEISESVYKRITNGEIFEETERFLKNNLDKPVFIYIHTMEPHAPYNVPRKKRKFSLRWKDEILKKLRINSTYFYTLDNPSQKEIDVIQDFYKDEVLETSKNFNSFDMTLKNFGLDDKILLIFTSDHGERFFEHESWAHGGSDVYNEVIRIPLILKYPGSLKLTIEQNVSLVDIFPTIVAYLDDETNKKKFMGLNLFDVSTAEDKIIYADGTNKDLFTYLLGKEKIIFDRRKILYFNLEKDKNEKNPKFLENIRSQKFGDMNLEKLLKLKASLIQDYHKKGIRLEKSLSPDMIKRLKSLGYLK